MLPKLVRAAAQLQSGGRPLLVCLPPPRAAAGRADGCRGPVSRGHIVSARPAAADLGCRAVPWRAAVATIFRHREGGGHGCAHSGPGAGGDLPCSRRAAHPTAWVDHLPGRTLRSPCPWVHCGDNGAGRVVGTMKGASELDAGRAGCRDRGGGSGRAGAGPPAAPRGNPVRGVRAEEAGRLVPPAEGGLIEYRTVRLLEHEGIAPSILDFSVQNHRCEFRTPDESAVLEYAALTGGRPHYIYPQHQLVRRLCETLTASRRPGPVRAYRPGGPAGHRRRRAVGCKDQTVIDRRSGATVAVGCEGSASAVAAAMTEPGSASSACRCGGWSFSARRRRWKTTPSMPPIPGASPGRCAAARPDPVLPGDPRHRHRRRLARAAHPRRARRSASASARG